MDSKANGQKANLKQYRRVNGKWQFVPIVKQDGNPLLFRLALFDVVRSFAPAAI
jgi:hypothetical protein